MAEDGVAQGTGMLGGSPVVHVVDGKAMMGRECVGKVSGDCVEANEVGQPMK